MYSKIHKLASFTIIPIIEIKQHQSEEKVKTPDPGASRPELQPPAASGRRFEQISKLLKINHPAGEMIYTWQRFQKNVDLSRIDSTTSRYVMQIIKKLLPSSQSDLLGRDGNTSPHMFSDNGSSSVNR